MDLVRQISLLVNWAISLSSVVLFQELLNHQCTSEENRKNHELLVVTSAHLENHYSSLGFAARLKLECTRWA